MDGSRRRLRSAALALALAAALAGCGLGQSGGVTAGPEDPVVAAMVNDRPIFREDVRALAVESGMIQDGEDLPEDSEAFHTALQELIQRRLFAMEAQRRGLDRSPDFRRAMDMAREQILARMIYREIDNAANDPDTLQRLFRENAQELGKPMEVHLRHIQFESREAALAGKRRLDTGERFEALAFELSTDRVSGSEGGDLGFALLDNLPDSLRQAAETTPVGSVAGPLQTEAGWHLIKLEERRERTQPSFADLRPQMVNWLRFQETAELRERLESRARVEIRSAPEAGMPPAGEATVPEDAPDASGEPPTIAGAPPPEGLFPLPSGASASAAPSGERANAPNAPSARPDPMLLPGAPAASPEP